MCDVGARCPQCKRATLLDVTTFDDIGAGRQVLICPRCDQRVTVTEPRPGLIMTRQDAVFRP